MSDDNILTISAGGKEGAFRGEPGVYTGTLLTHTLSDPLPAKQPKFPGETYRLHDWGFVIEGAPEGEEMVWMSSGTSTGPKSKTFAVITALFGGNQPPVGTQLDIGQHLIGRQALLDVRRNERGYLDVEGIMPLPKGPAAPKSGARAPQPVAALADANLPF